jgi:hypothetical protein
VSLLTFSIHRTRWLHRGSQNCSRHFDCTQHELAFLKADARITCRMCTRARRFVSWAVIYAVALHAALLGVAPVISDTLITDDPFSICRSEPRSYVPISQAPGSVDHMAGHACELCTLCSASVPPSAPDSLVGIVLPLGIAHILRPAFSAPRISLVSDPKLARGPPQVL